MEEQKILTPIKAIRAKCIECSGGNRSEADRCQIKDCPLYTYRHGRNPNRKPRVMTEEQREKMRVNLEKAREKRFQESA